MIPDNSHHHPQYKTAGLTFLVDRLLSVPMNNIEHDKELACIKNMAKANGFDPTLVDSMVERRFRRKELIKAGKIAPRKDKGGYTSIPYLGKISEKVGAYLGKIGMKVSYKSKKNLRSFFTQLKDEVRLLDKSGVYRVSCTSCSASYVGQTGRKLKCRLREHLRDKASEFKRHTSMENHNGGALDFQLLHSVKKSRAMNMKEGIEIKLDRLRSQSNLNKVQEAWKPRHFAGYSLSSLAEVSTTLSQRSARVELGQLS